MRGWNWNGIVNIVSRREIGSIKSPLDGRLIAIKDNICTRSLPTTCASRMLEKFSSPFDATVIKTLEDAGAVIGGKTNLDEFGMGSHSTHSRFGPVKSSFFVRGQEGQGEEESLTAGGSSGGSAVAVATNQCYAYVACQERDLFFQYTMTLIETS